MVKVPYANLYIELGTYSGNIEFNNTSECDYSLKAIRENILYVGQNRKTFYRNNSREYHMLPEIFQMKNLNKYVKFVN